MRYFLSLGSNLGNRRAHLQSALVALEKAGVKVLRSSSLYRTEPVGYAAQPWFYNRALEVSTALQPADLLALIKTVERDLGRKHARKNRPRTIDIDILLAVGRVVSTRQLIIPHPRMAERNFVLIPLLEIARTTVHPVLKKNISELKKRSQDKSVVRKLPEKASRSSA